MIIIYVTLIKIVLLVTSSFQNSMIFLGFVVFLQWTVQLLNGKIVVIPFATQQLKII